MNRDLLFFLGGLCFGIAAGFFVFRAVSTSGKGGGGSSVSESVASGTSRSQIGLESAPETRPLDEARASELEERASQNPSDAEVRAELGRLYFEAGRYDDAGAWLKAALEIAPSDLSTRTELALSLLNLGRLDDAVAAYEENLRIDAEHPASLLGLGRVRLYLQQDIDGGLALWEKLVAVAPSSTEAQSVRDELEALKSAHAGG